MNEVACIRGADGRIVAACRTDSSDRFKGKTLDHYEGLAVSLSDDDGKTWSKLNVLYEYGRHHPSLVLMPGREIVMTYVVRLGYPDDVDGFAQFGIEAVVSHDNGNTWDLANRYILNRWSAIHKGDNYWISSSQATSTVRLPDNSLLTAYGTGYRCEPTPHGNAPRDVGLVLWSLSENH